MSANNSGNLEDCVHAAIESHAGGEQWLTQAAKAHLAPVATVYHRKKGRKTRSESHEKQQLLSRAEEEAVVKWIEILYKWGFPPRVDMVRKMAYELQL